MGIIPEIHTLSIADEIVVADHRTTLSFSAARPVAACCIVRSRDCSAILLCAREHVMHVGRIGSALHGHAPLIEGGLLVDCVLVAVQFGYVRGDLHSLGVGPRAISNTVLGVYPAASLCREIGMPGLGTGAHGLG